MSSLQRRINRIVSCDRDGCILPARYRIVFRFWRIGASKQRARPVKVVTNLCACTRHTEDIKAADLLDNETKSTVLSSLTLRGFPMPDFATAELEFAALNNGHMAS